MPPAGRLPGRSANGRFLPGNEGGPGRPRLPDDVLTEVYRLKDDGLTPSEIQRETGLSRGQVNGILGRRYDRELEASGGLADLGDESQFDREVLTPEQARRLGLGVAGVTAAGSLAALAAPPEEAEAAPWSGRAYRNVQKRFRLSDNERRRTPPWRTEDTPRRHQIDGRGAALIGTGLGLAALGSPEDSAEASPLSSLRDQGGLEPFDPYALDDDQIGMLESLERPFEPQPDLSRPMLWNDDGSFSTVETITIGVETPEGERQVNIPTIIDGQRVSEDEAIDAFYEGRNPQIGPYYDTIDEAVSAAEGFSRRTGERRVPPQPPSWNETAAEWLRRGADANQIASPAAYMAGHMGADFLEDPLDAAAEYAVGSTVRQSADNRRQGGWLDDGMGGQFYVPPDPEFRAGFFEDPDNMFQQRIMADGRRGLDDQIFDRVAAPLEMFMGDEVAAPFKAARSTGRALGNLGAALIEPDFPNYREPPGRQVAAGYDPEIDEFADTILFSSPPRRGDRWPPAAPGGRQIELDVERARARRVNDVLEYPRQDTIPDVRIQGYGPYQNPWEFRRADELWDKARLNALLDPLPPPSGLDEFGDPITPRRTSPEELRAMVDDVVQSVGPEQGYSSLYRRGDTGAQRSTEPVGSAIEDAAAYTPQERATLGRVREERPRAPINTPGDDVDRFGLNDYGIHSLGAAGLGGLGVSLYGLLAQAPDEQGVRIPIPDMPPVTAIDRPIDGPRPLPDFAGARSRGREGLPEAPSGVNLPEVANWPFQTSETGLEIAPDPRLYDEFEIDPANKTHVRRLQDALRDVGLDPGVSDGIIGPRTMGAMEGLAGMFPEEYRADLSSDPSAAFRGTVAAYRGPASIEDMQAGFAQSREFGPMLGSYGVDNLYGPRSLGATAAYTGRSPDDPLLADLTPEERDWIVYHLQRGNPTIPRPPGW